MAAFRFTTAGESHGPGLVAIVEGLPAGLELEPRADRPRDGAPPARPRPRRADEDRARRGRGALRDPPRAHAREPGRDAGREPRLRELGRADEPLAGRRRGRGVAPPATRARRPRRGAEVRPSRRPQRARARQRPRDRRPGGRRRAREGVPRARSASASTATCCGSPRWRRPSATDLTAADFADVDESPVRCLDAEAGERMVAEIDRLRKANESLGGVFEVRAFGLVPGLGSYVAWDERLDGRLAQAVVSIQAVKGVSVGEAWEVAALPGSESHDEIFWSDERGLSPRDEPRRRRRGRDVERRAARRPRRAEADLDPDQAAALGRHRDQGAGAGDARAHRLDRRPGGRGGRRGDGRAGAGALLPREVRRRPHRRRSRRRSRRTGSGSIGAASPTAGPTRALVFIGFMGAGKSRARPRRARRRTRGARRRRGARARARYADRRVLQPRGRGRVPSPRGGARHRPARAGRRRRDRARRRQRALRAASARRSGATSSSGCRSTPRRPGGGSRASARWPATANGSRRCSPSGFRIYESLADAILPGDAESVRRARCPSLLALRELPAARLAWARSASGEYPAFVGRGLLGELLAATRASRSASRTPTSDRCSPSGSAPRRAGSRSRPASAPRRWAEAERVLRELARLGVNALRPPGGARRRASSATSRASARPPTSAGSTSSRCRRRWSPRWTPPTAARPGSTCRRRRTTSAPTTCPPRCSPTRRRSRRFPRAELAAGFVEVLKTALIAGGALWERVRAIDALDPGDLDELIFACARTKLEVVAADERDAGAAPGAQPRPHGRPRDRGGDRLSALSPRRGGRARAAGGAAALERRRAARRGRGAALAPRPADRARPPRSIRTPCSRRSSATRSGPRPGSASSCSSGPGEPRPGQSIDPGRVRAAVSELVAPMSPTAHNRVEVLHGVNLDMLGHRDRPSITAT